MQCTESDDDIFTVYDVSGKIIGLLFNRGDAKNDIHKLHNFRTTGLMGKSTIGTCGYQHVKGRNVIVIHYVLLPAPSVINTIAQHIWSM